VTPEALRHLQIAEWIVLALLMDSDEGPVIRELEIQTAGSRGEDRSR
jgi:hypothetical protein